MDPIYYLCHITNWVVEHGSIEPENLEPGIAKPGVIKPKNVENSTVNHGVDGNEIIDVGSLKFGCET